MIAKQVTALILALAAVSSARASAAAAKVLTPEAPIEVSAKAARFDLMTVDASQRRLLAAHSHAHTLTVVDLRKDALIGEIPVGKSSGVAVDTIDNKYFVGTEHGVAVVDRRTLKKVGLIKTPGPADAMIFDPANDELYVGHDDGKALWIIDAHSNKRVGHIAIPGAPELMALDANAHHLYLNIKPRNEVLEIDTTTHKILHHWSTQPANSPHGLALDEDAQRLFVGGRSEKIAVLSAATGAPEQSITIGRGNHIDQMAYDPQYHRLYCPDHGRLIVIDTQPTSKPVLATLEIPKGTHSATFDPVTHKVWIAYVRHGHSYVQSFKPAMP
ncbi:YncE family protein [Mangrovitalea sediminis]|uniref:YncE family protein n=1 Tax=Mangrovitalea sediminis TaxID=1982043 RepID=UPI000BE58D0E|nr:YncE family protein [Mangrovitalea sediminis]